MVPSWKRDINGVLAAHRMYACWASAWEVRSADLLGLCSVAAAVAYMHLPFRVDAEVADPPPFR